MNPALPALLTDALAGPAGRGAAQGPGRRRGPDMSAGYRAGAQFQGHRHADWRPLAYAVARMPATYAACAAVFARVAEVMPDFAPASLLDVGAGTGAASWAAVTQWPDIAGHHHAGSQSGVARPGAQAGRSPLRHAEILSGDLGAEKPKADLVVASYVLAELPQDTAAAAARRSVAMRATARWC